MSIVSPTSNILASGDYGTGMQMPPTNSNFQANKGNFLSGLGIIERDSRCAS